MASEAADHKPIIRGDTGDKSNQMGVKTVDVARLWKWAVFVSGV
jgi:hypothetical protein